jgi:hypothetical protein
MKENLGNDDGQDEEDDDSQYSNFDENYADKFNNENGDDDENDNLNSYLRNIQKKSILDQEDDDDDEDSDGKFLFHFKENPFIKTSEAIMILFPKKVFIVLF